MSFEVVRSLSVPVAYSCAQYDWSSLYPAHPDGRVEFADVGCGYGGLLVQLSPMFPRQLMIGNE